MRGGVLQPGAGASEPLALTPTAAQILADEPPTPLTVDYDLPARLTPAQAGLVRHLLGGEPGPVILRGPAGVGRRALAASAAREAGIVPVGGDRPAGELALLARLGLALPIVEAGRLDDAVWEGVPVVGLAEPGAPHRACAHRRPARPRLRRARRGVAARAARRRRRRRRRGPRRRAERALRLHRGRHRRRAAPRRAATRAGRTARSTARSCGTAARRQPEHALARLAALVQPAFVLDDLVVEADCRAKLGELVAHVELQHVVLDAWGFRRRLPRGQGVIALFAGPSGTGKTMAAEAVASALRQDLYRIDLSAVVSKYIGETEKNLATAFDEAERAGAVLFFDEADALFGKRTEVKDAHDRYANLEINYLLQRVETFTGLVILATNRQSALDEAFLRRLRFSIRFELPGAAARAELWRRSFPPGTPREELDFDALAVPDLSGGSIQVAALAAAYLAAADDAAVSERATSSTRCGASSRSSGARGRARAATGRSRDRPRQHNESDARGGGEPHHIRPARRVALRVEVGAVPQAGLLRPAIAARLAGRPFPSGPEDAVARAVADAVRGAPR